MSGNSAGGSLETQYSDDKNKNNKLDNNQSYSFYIRRSNEGGSSSYHPISSSKLRVLAKKTINVKYPTILFEVPSRLETYTTAAPITFGLTRTICKPKLKLPSTVLTLTMCSVTTASSANVNSGPSTGNHFSSNNLQDNEADDVDYDGDEAEQPHPLNQPISQIHQAFTSISSGGGDASSGGSSMAAHKPASHNGGDRHYRRYNTYHHSSQSWPTQTQPVKSTKRQNVSSSTTSYETEERLSCQRNVSSVFEEPLMVLQVK